MNEYQLATARRMLRVLSDRGQPYTLERLRGYLPAAVVADIKRREAEYRQANKDVAAGGSNLLSPDAADYWREAKRVLAFGKLALSRGSRKAEKALSHKCERLEESFEARVAPNERGMFLIYDPRAEWGGECWDDRWHSTRDFYFPLLRPDFDDLRVVSDPALTAQKETLGSLLEPARDQPSGSPTALSAEHLVRHARD